MDSVWPHTVSTSCVLLVASVAFYAGRRAGFINGLSRGPSSIGRLESARDYSRVRAEHIIGSTVTLLFVVD